MRTDPYRVQVRLSAEALANLDHLAKSAGVSREEAMRRLIDEAARGAVLRMMTDLGVNRAEARAYLGRRQ
jgi:hypothetical protein